MVAQDKTVSMGSSPLRGADDDRLTDWRRYEGSSPLRGADQGVALGRHGVEGSSPLRGADSFGSPM